MLAAQHHLFYKSYKAQSSGWPLYLKEGRGATRVIGAARVWVDQNRHIQGVMATESGAVLAWLFPFLSCCLSSTLHMEYGYIRP